MMSFREYVRGLSNYVDENTAYKKYHDFMANLSQSKVGRFFDANKDREWFRLKYHPVDSQPTLHRQNVNFMKRLNIFSELNNKNYFKNFPYTIQNANRILNLMNAIIIQLDEGPQDLVDQLLDGSPSNVNPETLNMYVPTKSTSLVIDDINIEVTLSELEEFCKTADPNLLRIAQLEPYYIEEGVLRKKVIAVFSNDVDIRDVCWKLGRTKLNNRLLNVSINRPIKNRVIPIDALSNHHNCIVNDIRYATILILNFDELKGLYGKRKQLLEAFRLEVNNVKTDLDKKNDSMQVDTESEDINNVAPPSPPGSDKSGGKDEESEKPFDVNTLDEEKEKEKKKLFEFKFNVEPSSYRLASKLGKSKNPILEGAHLYFVEFIESTQARYYLAKVTDDLKSDPVEKGLDDQDKFAILDTIVKNLPCSVEESSQFLDKLLWYLRIVHSFDFYKKTIYKQEDELTLKMGVVHVRDDPDHMPASLDLDQIRDYLQKSDKEYEEFGRSQSQRYVTKDEERYNYKSYGKVITDELTSFAQRVQKARGFETEEVYKCRHCTRGFQKLGDIGRHFVTKHRWAIDQIELDTDFFNAYLFDVNKINPSPPEDLMNRPPNRFAKLNTPSQMGEDPESLQQTIEAYNKMDSSIRAPAPRVQDESDPRNDLVVDYTDISFDDAI